MKKVTGSTRNIDMRITTRELGGGGAGCGVIRSIHVARGQGAVRMSQGGLFLYLCDGK